MSKEDNNLHERLLTLENEFKEMKCSNSLKNEKSEKKVKKQKKENLEKRKPTKYNLFVSTYINEQREQLGQSFNHKEAFKQAAKKWTETKENNKTKENDEVC